MKNRTYLIVLILLFINLNCENPFKDEYFTFEKKELSGIKTNGYYYSEGYDNKIQIYFFYNNGVIFNSLWREEKELFEEKIINGEFYETFKNNIFCWGLVNVEGVVIKIENYFTKDNLNKRLYIKSGILNDTTIYFNSFMRSNGTEKESINDTLYFQRFSPKPDSTNKWTK